MRQTARAIIINDNKILLMYRNKYDHEYYSLIGGGIELDETPIEALYREVFEETNLKIDQARLVIDENAGEIYGHHLIFLCRYVEGNLKLREDSIEFDLNKAGKNIFRPVWVAIDQLNSVNLLPKELKVALIDMIENGFPEQPIKLDANFNIFDKQGE